MQHQRCSVNTTGPLHAGIGETLTPATDWVDQPTGTHSHTQTRTHIAQTEKSGKSMKSTGRLAQVRGRLVLDRQLSGQHALFPRVACQEPPARCCRAAALCDLKRWGTETTAAAERRPAGLLPLKGRRKKGQPAAASVLLRLCVLAQVCVGFS